MWSITLNPGFVCIIAALIVLGAPTKLRWAVIAGAALAALWLMLDRDFGAAAAESQVGVQIVPLNLDALNRIFGIAMLIALIVLGMSSNARQSRSEDSAILLLAGAAVSGLFVGDLVSFVAAASLAGLAAAWVVFASPLTDASRTGVRLLIWHGIEGLLFLIGVAFQISSGATSSDFNQLDASTIGGGAIFAALLIRVGAPLAHVWLRDAVSHASPVGAGAISVFSSMLGVYALARLYPAEPLLIAVGIGMIVVGLAYAMSEDDMRRAVASGLTAQTGLCVTLIGVGSPLALAGAEAHAFTTIFAFLALQLVLGGILARMGHARVSQFENLSRVMPISAFLMAIAGLAAAGAPGFAVSVSTAIALEAMAEWELQWAWLAATCIGAGLLLALMLRPSLAAFRGVGKGDKLHEAPFPILLGSGLAVFFCVSVGLAPAWLYGLLPAAPTFEPYALERLAPQLELLSAAGVMFILIRAARLAAPERPLRVLDVDAFYRGPAAAAGRWFGVVMLRLYGAWQGVLSVLAGRAGKLAVRMTVECDRPYRAQGVAVIQMLTLVITVLVAIYWHHI